jgi:beta-lactamase regulating signal transducer with metallopeptidase domain
VHAHLSTSAIAQLLIAAAWQGVAIAAIIASLFRLLPEMSAAHRFRVWMAAFLLATLLPFASLITRSQPPASPLHAITAVSTVPHSSGSFLTLNTYWSWGLLALWIGLVAFSLLRFATGLFGIYQLLRSASPVDIASLPFQDRLQAGRREVRVFTSGSLYAPVATGFLRPAIILPQQLLDALTPEEMRPVLMHELEHLARRDDWTTLCIRALRCLLPLSPALYYIERQLCRERELACDDAVLHAEISPRGYALCLTRMAEMSISRKNISLVPSLLGEASQLTARVSHILDTQAAGQQMARFPLVMSLASMACTAAALLCCPNIVSFRSLPAPSPEIALATPAEISKPVLLKAEETVPARHLNIAHKTARRIAAKQTVPSTLRPSPLPDELQTTKTLVLWQLPANPPEHMFLLLVETTSSSTHSITIEREYFQI